MDEDKRDDRPDDRAGEKLLDGQPGEPGRRGGLRTPTTDRHFHRRQGHAHDRRGNPKEQIPLRIGGRIANENGLECRRTGLPAS